ncbi:MAG: gamma-glutamyltransferase [Bacteroidota bacterium]|jgi:gamma-glutamyltranspeptidase/glutathione hydrolase|nr:gamma-glutamyltransferase [Bacteroidota bacterium]
MVFRTSLIFPCGAVFVFVFCALPLFAQPYESNAGSIQESTHGIVVSASPEASAVGAAVLRAGGNAVDAAVATGFALAVTYPSAGNIGGGCYIVIRMADGRSAAIDARETAPAAAHRDMYRNDRGEVDTERLLYGPSAAGVPGSVDGLLQALETYGTKSREELLRPAIAFARDGFPLHRRLAAGFRIYENDFRRYPSTWRMFAPEGALPSAGATWTQPDLAAVLRRISDHGRDGFYRGETARLIDACMRRDGGYITEEDLAGYHCITRRPVQGKYRHFDILSMPPSSSGGITLLQMLGMIERGPVPRRPDSSGAFAHYLIETMRRAYADRAVYLGDPDFADIPVDRLCSAQYLDSLAAGIDPRRATPSHLLHGDAFSPREGRNTTHYSIVDRHGNAVSVTTTINSTYGSKYAVPGGGFLLNNEMDDFSAAPGTPNQFGLLGSEANSIQPGKRMLSSMTPTIVLEHDTVRLVLGSPGGSRIITTVLQVLLNVLEFRMPLDMAIARPRFHHQWYPETVGAEDGAFTRATRDHLESAGHVIIREVVFGRVDAIYRTDTGGLQGCSDPRGFGAAVAE